MVNFYGKEVPDVGDLVVCRIDNSINDAGYMVTLLEYDNKRAFISLKELTQAKWARNIRSLANEGDTEVFEVISLGDNGDVDLTRRHIEESSKEETFAKYKHWKRVYDYLSRMASSTDREEMVSRVIHPYLETENVEDDVDRNVEDDDSREDGDENGNMKYASTTTISISKWTERESIQFTSTTTRIVFENVVKLLEKPVESIIQTDHIQIPHLSRPNIRVLNRTLRRIESEFFIDIKSYSMKSATFQITTTEKMEHGQFMKIVENLQLSIERMIEEEEEKEQEETISYSEIEWQGMDNDKQPYVNIGIIGHVAHGKTTMIEAITGVDTRKYKKEIASNRTLNIGYTNARIIKCSCSENICYLAEKDMSSECKCPGVWISIVDCPGHNVLLSTMITGARIMDTCMLVVSADEECPQPQTAEHVAVMQIVGQSETQFADSIVIQNKVDLVSESKALQSKADISQFLQNTVFQDNPVIPASAQMRINVSHVLEYVYEYADKVRNHRVSRVVDMSENVENMGNEADVLSISRGLIVRTFDVNKPGSSQVLGAVIGGSILSGAFAVGDEIMLLPLKIKARIVSMKSDKWNLSSAGPGGLIAIQTDINPTYCNVLSGCSFVLLKDFSEERLIPANTEIKVKYNMLPNPSETRLKKDEKILINYGGCNAEFTIVKSSKDHHKIVMTSMKPIYVFPDESMCFTIIHNRRLVGFGRSLDHEKIPLKKGIIFPPNLPLYEELFTQFKETVAVWKENSTTKTKLPVPRVVYKNTYSTIYNFGSICEILKVTTEKLGAYIHSEMGARSYSVNGSNQLVLKGRTDERKIMSILQNFIMERRCILCKQNSISVVRNMGVRQRVCTNCSWKS